MGNNPPPNNPVQMPQKPHWVWRLCIGVLIGLLMFHQVYPRYISPIAQQASKLGVDPIVYTEVRDLQDKSQRGDVLSPDQVTRLTQLCKAGNSVLIKIRALTAIGNFPRKSTNALRAIQTVRDCLDDNNESVRLYAFSVLYKLCDPQMEEIAIRMGTDPSSRVQEMATKALSRIKASGGSLCEK